MASQDDIPTSAGVKRPTSFQSDETGTSHTNSQSDSLELASVEVSLQGGDSNVDNKGRFRIGRVFVFTIATDAVQGKRRAMSMLNQMKPRYK